MKHYLLLADVLGFSNIVSNLPHDSLSNRIETWTSLVEETSSEMEIKEIQLVSDTIFVREADSDDGLERLLRFSKLLLERGIEKSFPIRGAITYGEVTWGKLIFGEAVIKAYELERSLDWIGITFETLLNEKMPWSWDLACVYPVPRKSKEKAKPLGAIVWTAPEVADFINKWTSGGLHKKGQRPTWEGFSKLLNTFLFLKYIRYCTQEKLTPDKFSPEGFIRLYVP